MNPAEKASQENLQDNLTQKDATEKLTKEVKEGASALQNDIVATKTGELSAKVDASISATSDKNTDRPTRKEIRAERKELREERRDDKKLNRLIEGLKKEIAKTSVAKQELNKTTGEYNLLMLNLEDLRNFNDYLMKVRNKKIDPATEKFQPQNLESFLAMLMQMPYGTGYIEFVGKNGEVAKSGGSNVEYGVVPLAGQSGRKSGGLQFQNIDTSDDATFGEAYKEHGLRGLIKKGFDYMPNMTENQKDGRTNALFLGGMGFALFKLGKRFFTGAKNEKGEKVGPGFLGRLAIAGGVFLGSNMLTGKSPIELIDKALNGGMSREYLKGERGKGADGAAKLEKQQYVYPLTVSTIFGKTRISDLLSVLDDNFKIKDYDTLLQKAKADGNQEVVDMLNRVGKGDKESQIKQGLEQIGITKDNLTTFGEKTVDDLKNIYDTNLKKTLKYMTDNGLMQDVNDKEKIKKYNDLISSGREITDDDLKKLVETGVLYEQFEIKKDANRETLKTKINNLDDGNKFKIKVNNEYSKLFKINGTSEIGMESEDGKITLINLDYPSIKGLGIDSNDRKFTDKEGKNNYYELFLTANQLNKLKNKYEGRIYAAGGIPFKFEKGEIYFNEAKAGGGIIADKVVTESILGYFYFSSFPQAFKGQEQMIVNYLNKEVKVSSENIKDVVKYFNDRNMGVELTDGSVKSHGESIKIDTTNRKIDGLDRQFKNYLELIGAANLINTFKQMLKERQAQSENPIYTGINGNIAFNDRTIFEEMKTYLNRGPQGYGDTDIVKAGDLTFRKENTLKTISPTLYANRKEFVNYLNKISGFKEYVPEDKEAKELAEIKKKISETLNDGIDPAIDFGEDSMEYNKEQKKLIIKGIDEKKIQNDKLIENLGKLNKLVSRYDVLNSQYVQKIELPNVDLEPGETISVKYLKKLLDFNKDKVQLGANILKNKDMMRYVVEKKYSEGDFYFKENTNLDMNGIIILNYIFRADYDFKGLIDREDDGRLDFTKRVTYLLSGGETIIDPDNKKETIKIKGAPITLDPNHDYMQEWRRVCEGEDVEYKHDTLSGFINWLRTRNNDNVLKKITDYYNNQRPNVEDPGNNP